MLALDLDVLRRWHLACRQRQRTGVYCNEHSTLFYLPQLAHNPNCPDLYVSVTYITMIKAFCYAVLVVANWWV